MRPSHALIAAALLAASCAEKAPAPPPVPSFSVQELAKRYAQLGRQGMTAKQHPMYEMEVRVTGCRVFERVWVSGNLLVKACDRQQPSLCVNVTLPTPDESAYLWAQRGKSLTLHGKMSQVIRKTDGFPLIYLLGLGLEDKGP